MLVHIIRRVEHIATQEKYSVRLILANNVGGRIKDGTNDIRNKIRDGPNGLPLPAASQEFLMMKVTLMKQFVRRPR